MSTDAPAPVALPPVQQTDTHQLDKLPDLPPETPIHRHPAFVTMISYNLWNVVIAGASHFFAMTPEATNSALTGNATIHTWGGGAWMADKISRKGVYALAASKDGIQSNTGATP